MPVRTKGRPRTAETEPRAYIRWIKGRAYAELGAWAAWGGRRQEPLVEKGQKGATQDPNTAAILFGQRLAELRQTRGRTARRGRHPTYPRPSVPLSGYHLAAKADAKGRRKPSESELSIQRARLMQAARYFRGLGVRDLRAIEPAHVEAYMEHLRELASNPNRRTGTLSPATQRKYLDALGNMLERARSKGVATREPPSREAG